MYCCRRQKGEQRVRTAAGNRMKREWIGFLFLLLLSVRDIREKKGKYCFPLPGLYLHFIKCRMGFTGRGTGFLFSILLFVLSILTKEAIGKGDAFAVLLCACYLPFIRCFLFLWQGFLWQVLQGSFLFWCGKGTERRKYRICRFLRFLI